MIELAPSHFSGKAEDLIKTGRKTYHSDLAVSEPDHVCTAAATRPPERQPCPPRCFFLEEGSVGCRLYCARITSVCRLTNSFANNRSRSVFERLRRTSLSSAIAGLFPGEFHPDPLTDPELTLRTVSPRDCLEVVLLSWSLRSHWLWYRDNGLVAYAFVLGDHLSAEEENQCSNLNTEQDRDRGRKRPVNQLNLRHGRVVPDENVPGDFP